MTMGNFPAGRCTPTLECTCPLDEKLPDRRVGRNGPILSPPRSPDTTPLDFFLWGYIKDRVYVTLVLDINTLKRRIIEAFATITDEMLKKT